jgi:PAS domain S-box-containing protein
MLSEDERFEALAQASFEGIGFSADGVIIDANPQLAQMLRYDLPEIIGKPVADMIAPEDRELVRQYMDAGYEGRYENRLLRKDGSTLVVETQAKHFAYRGRTVRVTTVRDITERKQAEEALRASEQKFRQLHETMHAGVVFQDTNGKIVSMNSAAKRILGRTEEEFLGETSVSVEHHTIREDGSPFPGLEHPAMLALRTGREVDGVVMGVFNPLEDAYRWIEINATPLFREGEKIPYQVYTVFSDITERKQAEKESRASQALLRAVMEGSPDPIFVKDRESRIIMGNSALFRVWGKSMEEVLGKNDRELYEDPAIAEAIIANDRMVLQSGTSQAIEEVALTRDGLRTYLSTKTPFRNSNGEIVGILGIARDITERKQQEQQIEAHRQLLETVTSKLPTGVAVIRGADLKILLINPAYQIVAPGKEIIGKTIEEVWPETQPHFRERCLHVLATGETYHAVDEPFMIRRSPDSPLELTYFIWSLFRVPLPGDEGWGIMSVVLETTERKQAQSLLQRQAELLHLSYDAIIVWRLGGRIESWNKGAEELYGYSQEEAVDQVTHDLLKTIHPEPWPQIEAKLHERKFWEGELKHRTREGREVIVSARLQLVPDSNAVERVLEINRDITERKQAEGTLRESEAKLQAALASIPDAVFISDVEGRLVNFNDAFATYHRFRSKDECSRSIADCPTYLEAYMADGHPAPPEMWAIPRALRGETVKNTHYTLQRKDTGETWTGGYSFSPIRDKDEVIIGSVVVARDITEQQQMKEKLRKSRDELELRVHERTTELKTFMAKLEQSNQALQDFASIASHDMKEPLRKVISFGNMLRQKSGDSLGQSGKDYLNRMLHATERMQSLLTGLLDYSRVTTTSEPFEEIDLSDLIGEVLSDLEVRILKTGGKLNIGDLPVIQADPTQMRQLFQNLIGNALKFHKPGEKPMVQVRSASNSDSGCQIIVEDNGIGFDEQYLERIFAPFQRLHGRSEYEGTGMGLAICKKIVERHGGSITARSEPGKGSTFLIMLPQGPPAVQRVWNNAIRA